MYALYSHCISIWLCKLRTYLNLQIFSIQRCSFSVHFFNSPFWEPRNMYIGVICVTFITKLKSRFCWYFVPFQNSTVTMEFVCSALFSVWNCHLFSIYPLNILLLLNLQCNSFSFLVQLPIEKQIQETYHMEYGVFSVFVWNTDDGAMFFIQPFIFIMFLFSSLFRVYFIQIELERITNWRSKKAKNPMPDAKRKPRTVNKQNQGRTAMTWMNKELILCNLNVVCRFQ